MDTKVCSKCGLEKPIKEFYSKSDIVKKRRNPYYSKCSSCFREKANNYYHNNKQRVSILAKESYQRNRDYIIARRKRLRDKIKQEVIAHYSNGTMLCSCCPEKHIEFLTIDHINGVGKFEKRLNGARKRAGYILYAWLKKNNYPSGFRVLCYNCNCARGFLGYCPHEISII